MLRSRLQYVAKESECYNLLTHHRDFLLKNEYRALSDGFEAALSLAAFKLKLIFTLLSFYLVTFRENYRKVIV